MDIRSALITFEELIRNTNPDLEFDININTDTVLTLFTMAERRYVEETFLTGDSIKDNIDAIRVRSDILRNLIKRSQNVTINSTPLRDGGYETTINESDYWMFLSGVLYNGGLVGLGENKGAENGVVELDLINHYDLQKKIRTNNNEPVYKYIPIVIEDSVSFVFYLDVDHKTNIGSDALVAGSTIEIIYLAEPPEITLSSGFSLPSSTHYTIVKMAADIFLTEYKYKLGVINKPTNG